MGFGDQWWGSDWWSGMIGRFVTCIAEDGDYASVLGED